MIDPAADVARRIRRDAQKGEAVRYWAGWRLALTFGPYDQAFDPARVAMVKETVERTFGEPPPVGPEALAAQRDLWHLSVSWRGGFPVEEGKRLLAELVVAMGVPEDKRGGYEFARVMTPNGVSPQVTHWIWREKGAS